MEIKEEWKDIENYEGLYQISNLGRVKSLGNGKSGNSKERILKQKINKNGYCCVALCKEGKPKYYQVHRLVAQTFLPNPDNLPQVNHIDENKQNNCVSNLEFCTQKYNNIYGTRLERCSKSMIGKNKGKISHHKYVVQLSLNEIPINVYFSLANASRKTKSNNTKICECCKGTRNKTNNYKFKYLSDIQLLNTTLPIATRIDKVEKVS